MKQSRTSRFDPVSGERPGAVSRVTASLLVLLSATSVCFAQAEKAKPYSFEELVNLALKNRENVKSSAAEIHKTEYLRKSLRSTYFPSVSADSEFLLFNDDYRTDVVSDDPLNLPNIDPDIRDAIAQGLQDLVKPLPVRGQYIFHAGVNLEQPLTRLYSIYQQDKTLEQLHIGAKTRKKILERAISYEVTSAALSVLMAKELVEIQQASVSSLEDIADKARAIVASGSLGEYIELEAKAALSLARAKLLKAQSAVAVAASVLARATGTEAKSIENIHSLRGDPPAPKLSLEETLEYTAKHLPELEIFNSQQAAATHQVKAIRSNWFPHLALVAHYDFRDNVYLMPKNSFTVGLVARWKILDGGRRFYEAKSVDETSAIAQHNKKEAIQAAQNAAQTAWLKLSTIPQQIEALKEAAKAAEETTKAQRKRISVGQGATTEFLIAHNRLQQILSLLAEKRYEGWMTYVALKLSLGTGYAPYLTDQEVSR